MKIRLIGTTGDVNALDYGGGFVYADRDAVYWEWWDGPIGPNGEEIEYSPRYTYTVYSVRVPTDVFKEFDWADFGAVAASIGMEPDELREHGWSSFVMKRVFAIEAIVGYYGAHELDQYPTQIRGAALNRRWNRFWKKRGNPEK